MGVRDVIAQNPMVGVVIAVVAVAVVAWTQFSGGGGPGDNVNMTYFYDLESGEIVLMPTGTHPPATTEQGHKAVKANVYSCGECTADEWFFYIESLTEEAKTALESVGEDDDPTAALRADQMGRMFAEPPASGGEPQWVRASSTQGETIAAQYGGKGKCGGKLPNICRP